MGTLLLAAGLCGCKQQPHEGTETDNPVIEPPPPYESPIDFAPDAPGPPGCMPPDEDSYPTYRAHWRSFAESLVVGSDEDLGLFVFSVADPASPQLISSVDVNGRVAATEVIGDQLAVVVQQYPDVATDELHEAVELEPRWQLIHVDLSDPQQPELLGSTALGDEFWQLVAKAGALWVLSAEVADNTTCDLPGLGCGVPTRLGMQVRGYAFATDGFSQKASLDLPAGTWAWSGHDGFATAQQQYDGDGNAIGMRVAAARINGDELVLSEFDAATKSGRLGRVGIDGDRLFYFDPEPDSSSSTLHVIDLNSAEARELSRVEGLPSQARDGTTFTRDRVVVGDEQLASPAKVIDLSDPSSPKVTTMPEGISMVLPVPAEADEEGAKTWLGWGDLDGSGHLSVALIGADGIVSSAVTEFVASPGDVREGAPLYPPNIVFGAGRVAFPYYDYAADYAWAHAAVVDLTASPISIVSGIDSGSAEELAAVADHFVGASGLGVTAFTGDDASATGQLLLPTDYVFDVVVVGAVRVSLIASRAGIQAVAHDGENELGRWALPATASALFESGDQVLIAATDSEGHCNPSDQDDCARGIFSLDLRPLENGSEPVLRGPFALTQTGSGEGTEFSIEWRWRNERAALHMANGDWVLAADEMQVCTTRVECEDHAITPRSLAEANVAAGSPVPCGPGQTTCPEATAPLIEVYGTRAVLHLFRLRATDGGPEVVEIGSSELELPESRFADPSAWQNTVLVTRLEASAQTPSQQVTTARFMLDRFDVETPAKARALNVPGYVFGGLPNGDLLSVVPGSDEALAPTLHRLHVTDLGAYVESSQVLPQRFAALHVMGDHAYYVGTTYGCNAAHLQPIRLDDELTFEAPIALPAGSWSIADATDTQLLLAGPNYAGLALFDVSEAAPSLVGFYAGARVGHRPRIFGDDIWSAGGDSGSLQIEP